jgi:hypothetical protein
MERQMEKSNRLTLSLWHSRPIPNNKQEDIGTKISLPNPELVAVLAQWWYGLQMAQSIESTRLRTPIVNHENHLYDRYKIHPECRDSARIIQTNKNVVKLAGKPPYSSSFQCVVKSICIGHV